MSIKKIVKYGDETLRRKSKEVSKVSKKIQTLVHDLLDTMYAQNGVGLAAPQIGENLRVFVIDVSTGNEPLNPMVFI
ncbi:TPA: peptide deformylase, partial [Candidatus Gastranaerophilales bacterium HUM_21]